MAVRPVSKRAERGRGLLLWQTRDELVRARAWAVAGASALGALAALWVGTVFGGDANAAAGGVLLGAVTLGPAVMTAARARRLHKLVKQVDENGEADAEVEAQTLAGLDTSMGELEALVSSLPTGSIQESGLDALHAAEHAHAARARLIRRRHQLRHLRAVTETTPARRRLDDSLRRCEGDIRDLDEVGDELNASIAELVDMASDDAVETDLARVQETTERMKALSDGLRQVQTRSRPR